MTLALKILTSNSTRTVLDALIPAYEKSTGNKVSISIAFDNYVKFFVHDWGNYYKFR